jgi:hypothetical protein
MLLTLAALAAAASIDGTWSAEVPGRNGTVHTATFRFRSSGDRVEGSVSMRGRTLPIRNGSFSNGMLRFKTVQTAGDNEMTTIYEGRLRGQTINFTFWAELGDEGPHMEFTAQRTN